MRDVRYYSARNDELQKENDAIMDILSKHGFDGDKEIVRLVKRNLTLTKENEKLLSKMETMEGANTNLKGLVCQIREWYKHGIEAPIGLIDRVKIIDNALTNKDGK